jgi:GT2 family glycosyltransferase
MQVSFIIPLYNCLPLTKAMLASLRASLPRELPYEIIFVDDGSTDGTRDFLGSLAVANDVRVVLNPRNLGYAGANNRGAAVAKGEFLALLNNDLEFEPGWLEPMLAVQHRLGERAGMVGNLQYDFRSGALDHAGIAINPRGKPEHRHDLPWAARWGRMDALRVVDAVTGACTLVRRELFVALGGFDEGYANGGEDVDFCLRARAAGKITAVALRSRVRHHISASPGRKRRDEENSRRLTTKWRDELAQLAAESTWSAHYLATEWTSPHDPVEYHLAFEALARWLHLRRRPPHAAYAAMQSSIAHELARWETILGNRG